MKNFSLDLSSSTTPKAIRPPRTLNKACKFCKQGGLGWVKTPGGWRLVNSKGEIHMCLAANPLELSCLQDSCGECSDRLDELVLSFAEDFINLQSQLATMRKDCKRSPLFETFEEILTRLT